MPVEHLVLNSIVDLNAQRLLPVFVRRQARFMRSRDEAVAESVVEHIRGGSTAPSLPPSAMRTPRLESEPDSLVRRSYPLIGQTASLCYCLAHFARNLGADGGGGYALPAEPVLDVEGDVHLLVMMLVATACATGLSNISRNHEVSPM